MVKIAHVVQHLTNGGAPRVMVGLAKHSQKDTQFEHTIFSIVPPDTDGAQLALSCNVRYQATQTNTEIYQQLANFDIVHVHWWNSPQLDDFLRGPLPDCRLVGWFHVGGHRAPQKLSYDVAELFDFAVASNPHTLNCEALKSFEKQFSASRTAMVYGGSDFDRLAGFTPQPHTGFNVGYIGTVDFIKMHPSFVAMSAAVRVPEAQFLVCGTGGSLNKVHSQIEQLNVQDRIQLLGYQENIRDFLSILDVYGYPMCEDTYAASELNLQEAMFCGIPPVVFPYGAMDRLIINDFSGLVVKSENEYSQAIEYLYQRPDERLRLGKNAKYYASQMFGAARAAELFNPLYLKFMEIPKLPRKYGRRANLLTTDRPVVFSDLLDSNNAAGFYNLLASLNDQKAEMALLQRFRSLNSQETTEGETIIRDFSELLIKGGLVPYADFHKDADLHNASLIAYLGRGMPTEAFISLVQLLPNTKDLSIVKSALKEIKSSSTDAKILQLCSQLEEQIISL